MNRREDPQTYTKPFYTLEAYRNTYAHAIIHPRNANFNQPLQFNPVEIDSDSENSDNDPDDAILPPNMQRPTGRPKKRRDRTNDKKIEDNVVPRRVQKRGCCNQQGHSKRTCRAAI